MSSRSSIDKITEIGDTLHSCGCAPYKLEKYVRHYAHGLGVNVIVQATPTSVNYHFPDSERQLVINVLKPAKIDLSLLANTITRLNNDNDNDSDTKPIEPTSYPSWLVMFANILLPPSFLILVGSTLHTIGIALILGFLVWVCQMLCQNDRSIVVEFLSALITGMTVSLVSSLGIEVPLWGLSIAAIILFVPGLSIANSLECLAFNDLISGTALFIQSLFVLLKLFIGIYMGLGIGTAMWGPVISTTNLNEVPFFLPFIALPLLSLSLGIIFNARLIHIAYAFPSAALAMWGPLYLGFGSDFIIGTWVTTVLITLYGTWLAKRLSLTGAIFIVPGIIVLVPGSRMLIGASQTLFHESLLPITSVGMSAVYMFSAIVAGQITAYSLYSQKNRNLMS